MYVPITFVIKGLVAFSSALAYEKLGKTQKFQYIGVAAGGIIDMIFVAGGYFICEYFMYGAGAFSSIPANLIQGASGLILSLVLYPLLMTVPEVKRMTTLHHS